MPSSSSPLLQLGFPCEGKPSARDVLALSGNGQGLVAAGEGIAVPAARKVEGEQPRGLQLSGPPFASN